MELNEIGLLESHTQFDPILRKIILPFLITLLLAGFAHGQTYLATRPWRFGTSWGFDFPVSKFSSTHFFGFSANGTLYKHHFVMPDSGGSKPLGFFVNTGIDFYLG